MQTYPIPMVPGPVRVPRQILEAYLTDYGSADLEKDYTELYLQTEANLQQIYGTRNRVVIQTGEGMLALWTALRSVLLPGERVLSVATGVFGFGIADMARAVGASVKTVDIPYNQTITDWQTIEQAIADFRPKMITVVHCETPSGTLNPIQRLGELKESYGVPLLYMDAVASAGGTPVETDAWRVDLSLGGSQKVLSVPPGMCFLAVSPKAWEIISQVDYVGYDALKPFRTATDTMYYPYTPYWHGMAALYEGTRLLLEEGLENSFKRHEAAAELCRTRLARMGLTLFPAPRAIPSPTVTAVNVPEQIGWEALDSRFRQNGLVVGGSYGPLAGKVFRMGHMGSQADDGLVNRACDVIERVLRQS